MMNIVKDYNHLLTGFYSLYLGFMPSINILLYLLCIFVLRWDHRGSTAQK